MWLHFHHVIGKELFGGKSQSSNSENFRNLITFEYPGNSIPFLIDYCRHKLRFNRLFISYSNRLSFRKVQNLFLKSQDDKNRYKTLFRQYNYITFTYALFRCKSFLSKNKRLIKIFILPFSPPRRTVIFNIFHGLKRIHNVVLKMQSRYVHLI